MAFAVMQVATSIMYADLQKLIRYVVNWSWTKLSSAHLPVTLALTHNSLLG